MIDARYKEMEINSDRNYLVLANCGDLLKAGMFARDVTNRAAVKGQKREIKMGNKEREKYKFDLITVARNKTKEKKKEIILLPFLSIDTFSSSHI